MNSLRQWLRFCNRRVKQFTFFDMKSVQFCGVLTGISVARLYPPLLQLSIWWLLPVTLLFAARPLYVFFVGTSGRGSRVVVWVSRAGRRLVPGLPGHADRQAGSGLLRRRVRSPTRAPLST